MISLGIQISDGELAEVFRKIDSSGDGSLQFEEILEVIQEVGNFSQEDDATEAFKSWDLDGDGLLNVADIVEACAQSGDPLTRDEIIDMEKVFGHGQFDVQRFREEFASTI
jgi:Ca2+-binding EF-hand superfamily protein